MTEETTMEFSSESVQGSFEVEPMRRRRMGNLSPDRTRSRRARERSIEMRQARRRKGER